MTTDFQSKETLEQNAALIKRIGYGAVRNIPLVLQSEAAECGLACLCMVAGHYGYHTDLNALRQRFNVSMQGTNLKQILEMANHLKMSGRALQLEMDGLHTLQKPCLLHWDMNHFVVLKAVKKNKITVLDPAFGSRTFTYEEFAEHFTGIALELTPNVDFEKKKPEKELQFSQLWSTIAGLKRNLSILFLLSLVLELVILAAPFYMQTVIDEVLLRNDTRLLVVLALSFSVLKLFELITGTTRSWFILNMSSNFGVQMAANVFHHLIRLPMDWFEKRHLGDIVSRFDSTNEIREFIATGVIGALLDGVMTTITLVLMFYYSPLLAGITCSVVLLFLLFRLVTYPSIRHLTEENVVAEARETSHFMESMRAIQTVKLFQKETERQNLWQNRMVDATNLKIRIGMWSITTNTVKDFLYGFENIILIYFGARQVMDGNFTVGMLVAYFSYKRQFVDSSAMLLDKIIEFKMLGVQLTRLADIVKTPCEKTPDLQYGQSADITGSIEVRNLSFRYSEHEPYIFQNLSFHIEAGENAAILGPSGCGKSTLLKCMMGLIRPSSGEILVDGQDITKLIDYRKNIAAVMQNDALLSGSISENICSFDPQPDNERIVESAQLASIHDDIARMNMQYNTLVGDLGTNLSGGQKQRVTLARAIYRRPKILFMDEATSHLDIENEAEVLHHIESLHITRITVAHRKEAIASATRKIYMNECQQQLSHDTTERLEA